MKIYLAATAPGNERERRIKIYRRLLSYHLLDTNQMEQQDVFRVLVEEKTDAKRETFKSA